MLEINKLTRDVIGAAIEVHKILGPGLLESAYEECLCRELRLRNITYERQKELPIEYKGIKLDCGYGAFQGQCLNLRNHYTTGRNWVNIKH